VEVWSSFVTNRNNLCYHAFHVDSTFHIYFAFQVASRQTPLNFKTPSSSFVDLEYRLMSQRIYIQFFSESQSFSWVLPICSIKRTGGMLRPMIWSWLSKKSIICHLGNFSSNAFLRILYSGWNSDFPNTCKLLKSSQPGLNNYKFNKSVVLPQPDFPIMSPLMLFGNRGLLNLFTYVAEIGLLPRLR